MDKVLKHLHLFKSPLLYLKKYVQKIFYLKKILITLEDKNIFHLLLE